MAGRAGALAAFVWRRLRGHQLGHRRPHLLQGQHRSALWRADGAAKADCAPARYCARGLGRRRRGDAGRRANRRADEAGRDGLLQRRAHRAAELHGRVHEPDALRRGSRHAGHAQEQACSAVPLHEADFRHPDELLLLGDSGRRPGAGYALGVRFLETTGRSHQGVAVGQRQRTDQPVAGRANRFAWLRSASRVGGRQHVSGGLRAQSLCHGAGAVGRHRRAAGGSRRAHVARPRPPVHGHGAEHRHRVGDEISGRRNLADAGGVWGLQSG